MEPNKNKVSDFSGARVGDRVWDFRYGWGTIREVDMGRDYPLRVRFDEGCNSTPDFTFDGKYLHDDPTPTLFWDEIKFEIPAPPKREVKVRCKAWCNVYSKGANAWSSLYSTSSKAVSGAVNGLLASAIETTFELTLNEDQLADLPFEYEVIS